ncbi:MAG: hypothetical protein P4L16_06950 [Chlamydiales bacterium]|nr:hypothetical protein [Chlamydiales bacterium]
MSTINSDQLINDFVRLDESYNHLYQYRMIDGKLSRMNILFRAVAWVLNVVGFRTNLMVFMMAASTALSCLKEPSSMSGLQSKIKEADTTKLSHMQAVFKRCISHEVDLNTSNNLLDYLTFKRQIEILDEGVIDLAPDGKVFDVLMSYSGEEKSAFMKEVKKSFEKDWNRQYWYFDDEKDDRDQDLPEEKVRGLLAEREELKAKEIEGKTEEIKKKLDSIPNLDNIEAFCQQTTGSILMGAPFIRFDRPDILKRVPWSRVVNEFNGHTVHPRFGGPIVRVSHDLQKMSYFGTVNVYIDFELKISFKTSIEWDVKEDKLRFRPIYDTKVLEGCTKDEAEGLLSILYPP